MMTKEMKDKILKNVKKGGVEKKVRELIREIATDICLACDKPYDDSLRTIVDVMTDESSVDASNKWRQNNSALELYGKQFDELLKIEQIHAKLTTLNRDNYFLGIRGTSERYIAALLIDSEEEKKEEERREEEKYGN